MTTPFIKKLLILVEITIYNKSVTKTLPKNKNKNKMNIVPHILMQTGDIIKLPGGNINHLVKVVGLIEGKLLVEWHNNRFVLPFGFYLNKKDKGYFVPLIPELF